MKKYLPVVMLVLIMLAIIVQPTFAQDPATPSPDEEKVAGELVDMTVEATEDTAGTLEAFLDRLITAPQSELMRVLMVVGGVFLLAAGWRVYDFFVIIAGFIIGASVAISLLTTDNALIEVGALLLGGLLGAALSVFVYYLAVFLIGAYVGIVLTGALATALSLGTASPIVLLLGGLIGALVLLGLSFEFLVFVSALVGAQMLSLGLALSVTWTLIFAIVGILLQLGFTYRYNPGFRRYNYGYRRLDNPFRRIFR